MDNFGVVGGADESGVETLEGFRDSGFRVVAGGGIAQGRRDAEVFLGLGWWLFCEAYGLGIVFVVLQLRS